MNNNHAIFLPKFKLPVAISPDATICYLQRFLTATFSKSSRNIVVITLDHLSSESLFLPRAQRGPTYLDKIISKAAFYPDYQITVIHVCLNMPDQIANVKFICAGPECILQSAKNHFSLSPQSQKTFDKNYFWLSLNNNRRVHRYLTTMFLLGNNVEHQGLIRIDPTEILQHQSWDSYLSWWAYNEHNEIFDLQEFFQQFQRGFYKIKNNIGFESKIYSQLSTPKQNDKNFDQFLRPLYSNSAVEIVNETIWFPDAGGVVSEKYLNSVYGFNFPIIISVKNTVAYLKTLGFDMFDDVIDHSYDSISNHAIRLVTALKSNLHLLQNRQATLKSWYQCEDRMFKNVKLAQSLHQQYFAKQ